MRADFDTNVQAYTYIHWELFECLGMPCSSRDFQLIYFLWRLLSGVYVSGSGGIVANNVYHLGLPQFLRGEKTFT